MFLTSGSKENVCSSQCQPSLCAGERKVGVGETDGSSHLPITACQHLPSDVQIHKSRNGKNSFTMVSFGHIPSSNQSLPCHPRERGEILRNVAHRLLLCIQTPSMSNTAGQ